MKGQRRIKVFLWGHSPPGEGGAQGSITVFLSIVFLLFFSFVGVAFEQVRILSSETYVRVAASSAAATVFGKYNRELYQEYGLYAYGGYGGRDELTLQNDFLGCLEENLVCVPEDSHRAYADLYRFAQLQCQIGDRSFLTDADAFCGQVKEYLKSEAVSGVTEALAEMVTGNTDMKDAQDKLSMAKDYEEGKYDSPETEEAGEENEEAVPKKATEEELEEDSAGGNPLKCFSDMMRDGILGMVCDQASLSKGEVVPYMADRGSAPREKEEEDATAADYLEKLLAGVSDSSGDGMSVGGMDTSGDEMPGGTDTSGNGMPGGVNGNENEVAGGVGKSGNGMPVEVDGNENEVAGGVGKSGNGMPVEADGSENEVLGDSADGSGNEMPGGMPGNENAIQEKTQNDKGEGQKNLAKIELITYAQKQFSHYGEDKGRTTKYGMEYLAAGKEEEKDNLAYIVNRLLALRLLVNFVYVVSDGILQEKSLATATLLAGFTGIPPVITAVQYTILLILAFQEACVDITALLMGKSVPAIKNRANFKMAYEEICLGSRSLFQKKAAAVPDKTKGGISYGQYIFALLLTVSRETLLERMLDLIQYDLRQRFNQSFCIQDAVCMAVYHVDYQIPFLFSGLPYVGRLEGGGVQSVEVRYSYEG